MPNPTDPHAIAEAIVRVDSLTNLLNAGSRSRLVERIAAAIENERSGTIVFQVNPALTRSFSEAHASPPRTPPLALATPTVETAKPLRVLGAKELQWYQKAAARRGWSVCTPETPATKDSAWKAYHPYAHVDHGPSDEVEYYFCPICGHHWLEELPQ